MEFKDDINIVAKSEVILQYIAVPKKIIVLTKECQNIAEHNITVCKAVTRDQAGHYIFVKGTINDEPLILALVYVPNSGQVWFFKGGFLKVLRKA